MIKIFIATAILMVSELASASVSEDDWLETACVKASLELRKGCEKECFIARWEKYKNMCSETGEYESVLGSYIQAHGNEKEGQEILLKVIKEKGERHDMRLAYGSLTHSYLSQGNHELAKKYAKEGVVKYPNWYFGYLQYAKCFLAEKQYLEAKKQLEHSLLIFDREPMTYALLSAVEYNYRDGSKSIGETMRDTLSLYKKALAQGKYKIVFLNKLSVHAGVHSALALNENKLAAWTLEVFRQWFPEHTKEPWYKELKDLCSIVFEQRGLKQVFTCEEVQKLFNQNMNPLTVFGEGHLVEKSD